MRNLLIVTMFALLLCPIELSAHRKMTPTAETFSAFWIKFKSAVARSDKAKVADMTKLPFLLAGEELNREGFINKFDSLFDNKVKKCFAKGKAVKDGEFYSVVCGETIYLFGKVGNEYKFTEIGVND